MKSKLYIQALKNERDIRLLFNNHKVKSIRTQYISFYWHKNTKAKVHKKSFFLICVSKKSIGIVKRNRLKRVCRHLLQVFASQIKPGYHFALFLRQEILNIAYAERLHELFLTLKQAQLLISSAQTNDQKHEVISQD